MSDRFKFVILRIHSLKKLLQKFFMRRVFKKSIFILKVMLRVNEEPKSAWLCWGLTIHHASVWRVGGMSSGARAGIWTIKTNADVFYINGAWQCFYIV